MRERLDNRGPGLQSPVRMPVSHFDLVLRRPLAGGRAFGEVGPYEELKGRLRFAIDPAHPANARITDVELAPRNRAGPGEFPPALSLLPPLTPPPAPLP